MAIVVKVVACVVGPLMVTARAGHYVVRIQLALAFSQIGEEENRGSTLFASDDDVPRAVLRFNHRGPAFCRGRDLVQARKPGSVSVL